MAETGAASSIDEPRYPEGQNSFPYPHRHVVWGAVERVRVGNQSPSSSSMSSETRDALLSVATRDVTFFNESVSDGGRSRNMERDGSHRIAQSMHPLDREQSGLDASASIPPGTISGVSFHNSIPGHCVGALSQPARNLVEAHQHNSSSAFPANYGEGGLAPADEVRITKQWPRRQVPQDSRL